MALTSRPADISKVGYHSGDALSRPLEDLGYLLGNMRSQGSVDVHGFF